MQRNIQTFGESLKLRPTAIVTPDLCLEPCDNGVIWLSVLLGYLMWKMLQEMLTLTSHSPLVPDTKGVNELSSTSNTRCWHLCFF